MRKCITLAIPFVLLTLVAPTALAQTLPNGDDDTAEGEARRESEAEKKARIEKEIRDEAEKEKREKELADEERLRIEAEVRAKIAAEGEEISRKALEAENAKKREAQMRKEAEDRIRREAELKVQAEAKLRAEQVPVKSEAEIRAEVQEKIRKEEAERNALTERARAKAVADKRALEEEKELMDAKLKKEERELELKQVKGRNVVAGFGLNHSFTYTSNSVVGPEGETVKVSNSALFLSAAPRIGFFVGPENLEVNAFGGVLLKQISVTPEGDTAIEPSGFLGVGVNYHLPMSPRLFFIFGADLAGYYGGAKRPVEIITDADNPDVKTTFDVDTSSIGAIITGRAGPGYMLNTIFQVRASLEGNAVLGSESFTPPPTVANNFTPAAQRSGQYLFNTGIRISLFAFF